MGTNPRRQPPRFGVEKHVRAEEARPPVVAPRRCGAVGNLEGSVVACTLDAKHGGVHALRVEEDRSEVNGTPTTVYRTVATWRDGRPAGRYREPRS